MLLATSVLLLLLPLLANASSSPSRHLVLQNDSGEMLAVDWMHPDTHEAVNYWQGRSGDVLKLNAFVNHTFVVRSLSHNHTISSGAEEGRLTTSFTIPDDDNDDQDVVIKKVLEVVLNEEEGGDTFVNRQASEMSFRCRIASDNALAQNVSVDKVANDLISCLEQKTAELIVEKNEELTFEADLRLKISAAAENYTCVDTSRETTTPIEERIWTHEGVTRNVGVLHNRPASQIHVLHDFISREECDAIEQAAKPLLHRGTVADGKGGSKLSENRKAWQAGISIDWEENENEGDLVIAAVSRRLFAYANHVTGYNMTIEGQEDLMSIQYFGNGINDPKPDRYTAHCDGECDGMPHKAGGRVATMVMYCDVPEIGGGTNFQNSNVFVKPKAGAAAFFSYMDPVTGLHEKGFTSHSGCPVYEGTKRIAVQWMRVGVDAANPWDSFDTNTVKIKSTEEVVDF